MAAESEFFKSAIYNKRTSKNTSLRDTSIPLLGHTKQRLENCSYLVGLQRKEREHGRSASDASIIEDYGKAVREAGYLVRNHSVKVTSKISVEEGKRSIFGNNEGRFFLSEDFEAGDTTLKKGTEIYAVDKIPLRNTALQNVNILLQTNSGKKTIKLTTQTRHMAPIITKCVLGLIFFVAWAYIFTMVLPFWEKNNYGVALFFFPFMFIFLYTLCIRDKHATRLSTENCCRHVLYNLCFMFPQSCRCSEYYCLIWMKTFEDWGCIVMCLYCHMFMIFFIIIFASAGIYTYVETSSGGTPVLVNEHMLLWSTPLLVLLVLYSCCDRPSIKQFHQHGAKAVRGRHASIQQSEELLTEFENDRSRANSKVHHTIDSESSYDMNMVDQEICCSPAALDVASDDDGSTDKSTESDMDGGGVCSSKTESTRPDTSLDPDIDDYCRRFAKVGMKTTRNKINFWSLKDPESERAQEFASIDVPARGYYCFLYSLAINTDMNVETLVKNLRNHGRQHINSLTEEERQDLSKSIEVGNGLSKLDLNKYSDELGSCGVGVDNFAIEMLARSLNGHFLIYEAQNVESCQLLGPAKVGQGQKLVGSFVYDRRGMANDNDSGIGHYHAIIPFKIAAHFQQYTNIPEAYEKLCSDLSTYQDESPKISTLCAFTGVSAKQAVEVLEQNGGNVSKAAQYFWNHVEPLNNVATDRKLQRYPGNQGAGADGISIAVDENQQKKLRPSKLQRIQDQRPIPYAKSSLSQDQHHSEFSESGNGVYPFAPKKVELLAFPPARQLQQTIIHTLVDMNRELRQINIYGLRLKLTKILKNTNRDQVEMIENSFKLVDVGQDQVHLGDELREDVRQLPAYHFDAHRVDFKYLGAIFCHVVIICIHITIAVESTKWLLQTEIFECWNEGDSKDKTLAIVIIVVSVLLILFYLRLKNLHIWFFDDNHDVNTYITPYKCINVNLEKEKIVFLSHEIPPNEDVMIQRVNEDCVQRIKEDGKEDRCCWIVAGVKDVANDEEIKVEVANDEEIKELMKSIEWEEDYRSGQLAVIKLSQKARNELGIEPGDRLYRIRNREFNDSEDAKIAWQDTDPPFTAYFRRKVNRGIFLKNGISEGWHLQNFHSDKKVPKLNDEDSHYEFASPERTSSCCCCSRKHRTRKKSIKGREDHGIRLIKKFDIEKDWENTDVVTCYENDWQVEGVRRNICRHVKASPIRQPTFLERKYSSVTSSDMINKAKDNFQQNSGEFYGLDKILHQLNENEIGHMKSYIRDKFAFCCECKKLDRLDTLIEPCDCKRYVHKDCFKNWFRKQPDSWKLRCNDCKPGRFKVEACEYAFYEYKDILKDTVLLPYGQVDQKSMQNGQVDAKMVIDFLVELGDVFGDLEDAHKQNDLYDEALRRHREVCATSGYTVQLRSDYDELINHIGSKRKALEVFAKYGIDKGWKVTNVDRHDVCRGSSWNNQKSLQRNILNMLNNKKKSLPKHSIMFKEKIDTVDSKLLSLCCCFIRNVSEKQLDYIKKHHSGNRCFGMHYGRACPKLTRCLCGPCRCEMTRRTPKKHERVNMNRLKLEFFISIIAWCVSLGFCLKAWLPRFETTSGCFGTVAVGILLINFLLIICLCANLYQAAFSKRKIHYSFTLPKARKRDVLSCELFLKEEFITNLLHRSKDEPMMETELKHEVDNLKKHLQIRYQVLEKSAKSRSEILKKDDDVLIEFIFSDIFRTDTYGRAFYAYPSRLIIFSHPDNDNQSTSNIITLNLESR